jgi:hypothetical protein
MYPYFVMSLLRSPGGHGRPADAIVDRWLNPGQSRYPAGPACAPNAGRMVQT